MIQSVYRLRANRVADHNMPMALLCIMVDRACVTYLTAIALSIPGVGQRPAPARGTEATAFSPACDGQHHRRSATKNRFSIDAHRPDPSLATHRADHIHWLAPIYHRE